MAGIFVGLILFNHISGIHATLIGAISINLFTRHMFAQVSNVLVLFVAGGVMLAMFVEA